jgi:hypothetical protein
MNGSSTRMAVRRLSLCTEGQEIGPPLFHRIVAQLGIDPDTFARLR